MPGRRSTPLSSRALVLQLDSPAQREMYDRSMGAGAERELVAMIRTAVLLSESLIITDSMLLDGTLFLSLGPDGVARLLGVATHDLPLTVLASTDSLRAALEAKLTSPSFVWQLSVGGRFREGDESWPYRRVMAGWDAWIESAEHGDFRLERYAGELELRFGPLSALPGSAAHRLAEQACSRTNRSEVTILHRAAAEKDPEEAHGLEMVATWWNEAYLIAIARANRAQWLSFPPASAGVSSDSRDRSAGARPGRGDAGERERVLHLSGSILEAMRTLPPPVYGTVLHALRAERAAFRQKQTPRALAAIAYGVLAHLQTDSRGAVLRRSTVRVAFAVAAVAVALIPERWDGADTGWLVLGVLALVTIPWGDLLTLRSASRRTLAAVISVRGQHSPGPRRRK